MRCSRPTIVTACVIAIGVALSGCSTIKKFTGQRDDTVLQGSREEVLPPQKIQPPEPEPVDPAKCKPLDTKCLNEQGADGTAQ